MYVGVPGADAVDAIGGVTLPIEVSARGHLDARADGVAGGGDVVRERVYLRESSSGAAVRHEWSPGASFLRQQRAVPVQQR